MGLIANVAAGSTNQNDVTTAAIDTTGATVIVMVVASWDPIDASTEVSDSKGNTWTGLIGQSATGTLSDSRLFYVVTPIVGSGHTFSVSRAASFPSVAVAAFDNDIPVFNIQNGATAEAVTSIQAGSLTPVQNGALLVAGIGIGADRTLAINGGFTITDQVALVGGQHYGCGLAFLVQGTAAASNPEWSWIGATDAAAVIAAFTTIAGVEGPVVVIEGHEINPLRWSFNIQATANGLDTMTCDIESSLGESPVFRPDIHEEIVIAEDGERVFAGYITAVREQGFDGPNGDYIVTNISASDYSSAAKRRYVTEAVGSGSPLTSLKDFLTTLVDGYLDDYGVTLHPSQSEGPVLPEMSFDRVLLSTVLDQLARATGFVWGFTYNNELRMWQPGDLTAPFDINTPTDDPAFITGDIYVEKTLDDRYANRVLVVGDKITELGRVEVFVSTGVETFFEPEFQILSVPQGVIEIEGGSIPTGDRRWETITDGIVDDAQWHYNTTTNRITRFESSTSSTPEALESGQTATFTFNGEFSPFAQADDLTEQGLYGVWEYVQRVTGVTSDTTAQALADEILAERATAGDYLVRYRTRQTGVFPGQVQTIQAPERNVSGEFLITDVNTSVEPGSADDLLREVSASRRQRVEGNWREFYEQLSSVGSSVSVGGTISGGASSSAAITVLTGDVEASGPGSAEARVQGGQVLSADPGSPITEGSWWFQRDGGSPETVAVKAQINGTTLTIVEKTQP